MVSGTLPLVSLDNLPAEIPDRSGFDPVKANRINRFFNPFRGQPGHLFRCLGDSKETLRGLSGHFVLRSQTEKAGDQNLERVPFRGGHLDRATGAGERPPVYLGRASIG